MASQFVTLEPGVYLNLAQLVDVQFWRDADDDLMGRYTPVQGEPQMVVGEVAERLRAVLDFVSGPKTPVVAVTGGGPGLLGGPRQ